MLDAVIIQILIKKLRETDQRPAGLRNQLFVSDFEIIPGNSLPVIPALTHHPRPVQGSGDQTSRLTVPWEGPEPIHGLQGERDISPITDNVNEQGFWNVRLDCRKMKYGVRIVNRPAVSALGARDVFHHDPDEISTVSASRHHLGREFDCVQPRPVEALATQPGFQGSFSI